MEINYITEKNINVLERENVYIYGAGEYAHDIKYVLENNGIRIKAFIVDDKYIIGTENRDVNMLLFH